MMKNKELFINKNIQTLYVDFKLKGTDQNIIKAQSITQSRTCETAGRGTVTNDTVLFQSIKHAALHCFNVRMMTKTSYG